MSIKKAICSSTSSLEQDICNLHPACVRYVSMGHDDAETGGRGRGRGEGEERGGEGRRGKERRGEGRGEQGS